MQLDLGDYQENRVIVPDHLYGGPLEEFIQIHDVMGSKIWLDLIIKLCGL